MNLLPPHKHTLLQKKQKSILSLLLCSLLHTKLTEKIGFFLYCYCESISRVMNPEEDHGDIL